MFAVIEREVVPATAEPGLRARHDLRGWQTVGMLNGVDRCRCIVDSCLDEAGQWGALDLEVSGRVLADVVNNCVVFGAEDAVMPEADWGRGFWEGPPDD